MENLSLYGHPNESWELNLPADVSSLFCVKHLRSEGLTDELGAEAMMFEALEKVLLGGVYLTEIFVLAEDLSPLPEADTGGVTVIENSTPIAETASSKTNSALQPEDATTRACSIQYETSISLLGEDMPPPLPEADKDGGVIVTESSTPIAEAASSKTNNGSQTEDIQKPDDESTKPVTLRFSRDCFFYKAWYVVVIYNATNQMS
ncbi:unnamed protein product [Brassica napus]|uniref:(rape) hypothetical protein n=1 Tax=Brassica napus TaxID=3708 RepID=A0A816PSL4_BRANA|nr:unnamed protein product [Brassica napus]